MSCEREVSLEGFVTICGTPDHISYCPFEKETCPKYKVATQGEVMALEEEPEFKELKVRKSFGWPDAIGFSVMCICVTAIIVALLLR